MDRILVCGGRPLHGEVQVSGSKNSALPLLFASLLTSEPCRFRNVPELADVRTTVRLLQGLGVEVRARDPHAITLQAGSLTSHEAPYDLVKTMRASFLALGPLLAREGRARVSTPGGCAIGARPVNLHLAGLEKMGARLEIVHGYVEAEAPRCASGRRLRGARIVLDSPSVGATENLMMAAALAEGVTEIVNAAREPEIEDLAAALASMGVAVDGAGAHSVRIEGAAALGGIDHEVIADRIEAGTFLVAAAITGGDCLVRGARGAHLEAFLRKLEEAGVQVERQEAAVRVRGRGRPRAVDVKTAPFPGFATDLQAQMMALMAIAEGSSRITETIFENRFMHALELVRLGADIAVDGSHAVVRGVARLSGAPVMATDLRASVSLILAGLAADNTTEIRRVYHLDRGYERIEAKLSALGADIRREQAAPA
ncbi:MAG TPA: UDP-N-acetylglucosamine 1-carboxyvinyltransferase [Candidatus Binatia bacterium]|nr:UDP-N-acetylglucosamine 1-carboxyvinyltransferase [Candidatus Binatia bacterium]